MNTTENSEPGQPLAVPLSDQLGPLPEPDGPDVGDYVGQSLIDYATREVARAVAAERERCANLCERYADAMEKLYGAGGGLDGDLNAIGCARALAGKIRA